MSVKEVNWKAKKQILSSLLSENNAKEAIKELEKLFSVEVTRDSLKQTRIGVFITDLRKHKNANDQLKQLSKDLITKWKQAINDNTVSGSSTEPIRTTITDQVNITQKEKTRAKCTEMLYNSLAIQSTIKASLILDAAVSIEKEVCKSLHYTTGEYKSKMRSLVSNLKLNSILRENILNSTISPFEFSQMTAQVI
jgi:transcription elongation factor S-II